MQEERVTMSTSTNTSTGAALNRGSSKQDWCTPPEFLTAVHRRFGKPEVDLACSGEINAVALLYSAEHDRNSLARDWRADYGSRFCWLNPPYANIKPWARKCAEHAKAGGKVLLLVPAAVGSNWFRDYVFGQSTVYLLNGRLTFGVWGHNEFGDRCWRPTLDVKGKPSAYPKDLMLCAYGINPPPYHVEMWDWKKQ